MFNLVKRPRCDQNIALGTKTHAGVAIKGIMMKFT